MRAPLESLGRIRLCRPGTPPSLRPTRQIPQGFQKGLPVSSSAGDRFPGKFGMRDKIEAAARACAARLGGVVLRLGHEAVQVALADPGRAWETEWETAQQSGES